MIEITGYKLIKELGKGGMATVYLAIHELLDREVALKVHKFGASDPAFRDSFVKEGRVVAKLEHPHIVKIYDIGTEDHRFYMAMEYIKGGTLKDKLKQSVLSVDEVLSVIDQTAQALFYAHEKGYIHRDIKPANILFREKNDVVLADFGIAKLQGTESDLTQMGYLSGTPSYMAPEQSMGEEVDARTDLYSLGVVLYEMLTGRKPFQGDNTIAVTYKHAHEEVPKLPLAFSGIQSVLDKALAKDKEDRYPDVMEFSAALREAFIGNEDDDLTVIQPVRQAVSPSVDVGLSPEQAASIEQGNSEGQVNRPKAGHQRSSDREGKSKLTPVLLSLLLGLGLAGGGYFYYMDQHAGGSSGNGLDNSIVMNNSQEGKRENNVVSNNNNNNNKMINSEVNNKPVDIQKADEPKADEPNVDEPKVDEPKVDEPKVDEPKVDEPDTKPSTGILKLSVKAAKKSGAARFNVVIKDEHGIKLAHHSIRNSINKKLPPGNYKVTVKYLNHTPQTKDITVSSGKSSSLIFDFKEKDKGFSLNDFDGVIVNATLNRRYVKGAKIVITNEKNGKVINSTSGNSFVPVPLPRGKYRIVCQYKGESTKLFGADLTKEGYIEVPCIFKGNTLNSGNKAGLSKGKLVLSASLSGRPLPTGFIIYKEGKRVASAIGAPAYSSLPAGKYSIIATYKGKKVTRWVDLKSGDSVAISFPFAESQSSSEPTQIPNSDNSRQSSDE